MGACGFSEADIRMQLQVRYDEMTSAMAAHDGAALATLLAPNFVSIDTSGSAESGSQMVEEVNDLPQDPNKTSATTLVDVAPQANAVVVRQRYEMHTLKTGPDGAPHRVELVTLSTDTWVNANGAWLIQRTVTNDLSYYVDGALKAHQARP
jgi:hypothetical protein